MVMRRIIPALVVSAVMAGTALVAPQQSQAASQVGPHVRLPIGCTAPAPTTPAGFNAMLGHTVGWLAGDGGHTAIIDNGRRVWSFGDSLLSSDNMYHNALVVQNKGCATSVERATEVVPNQVCGDDPLTPREEGYCWGGPIAYANGTLYMLAPWESRLPEPPCTFFCFKDEGIVLVSFTVPPNGKPVLTSSVKMPISPLGIKWDTALTISNGMALIYGNRDDGDIWTFGNDIYLARVPVTSLFNKSAWSYWDGAGFITTESSATRIMVAANGPEGSFSVEQLAGEWSIVSTVDGSLGHAVMEWRAASPWGPWTIVRQLGDFVDDPDHGYYLPMVVAGTNLHLISQNWSIRNLGEIRQYPRDWRIIVW
jgi:hypothetical protein